MTEQDKIEITLQIVTVFDQVIRYCDDRDIISRQDLANHLAAFSDRLDEADGTTTLILDALVLTLRNDLLEYPDGH